MSFNDAVQVQENQVYDLGANNTINVSLHLNTPTRLLKVQLMQNQTNNFIGYLSKGYSTYLGRNMNIDGTSLYNTTINGTIFTDPKISPPLNKCNLALTMYK